MAPAGTDRARTAGPPTPMNEPARAGPPATPQVGPNGTRAARMTSTTPAGPKGTRTEGGPASVRHPARLR